MNSAISRSNTEMPVKEIDLFLIPAPGSKAEFLAKVAPVDPNQAVIALWNAVIDQTKAASEFSGDSSNGERNPKIVLEGYTRDGWAWKPNKFIQTFTVKSVDGRNKVPGFLDYLKGRQKSAFGRFVGTGLCIVPFTQTGKDKLRMTLSLTQNFTKLEGCTLQPLPQPKVTAPPMVVTKRPGGGGLLGKLVGAQKRTNQHMAVATSKGNSAPKSSTLSSCNNANSASLGPSTTADITIKTAQQALSDFRQSMQMKMLDFDVSDEETMEVKLSLSEHQAGLSTEDKTRVTMDVLKYMVYEAAEEVNEEWIAHKEPSEFMDEVIIIVYKEGAAPPEVLEEINKGELPDEVRGQQRAIATERQRQVQVAESRNQERVMQQAHREIFDEEEEIAALNTKKRDRRTIEDYEREKRELSKRGRLELGSD